MKTNAFRRRRVPRADPLKHPLSQLPLLLPQEDRLGVGGQYQHAAGVLSVHDAHEGCPNALNCLPDTEGRPQHTLPIILRCATLGSANKRLMVRDIYAAMEE